MKRKKLGWSLVIVVSTAALIGYGYFGFSYFNLNNTNLNNQKSIISSSTKGCLNDFRENDSSNFNCDLRHKNMMGNFNNHMKISAKTISTTDANQKMIDSLKTATIDKNNNTITYSGNTLTIVMFEGTGDSKGSFIIGGLTNPTIVIPKGTTVTLCAINQDTSSPQEIEITTTVPTTTNSRSIRKCDILDFRLPAATATNYATAEGSFSTSNNGTYYYTSHLLGPTTSVSYGKILVK